MTKRPTFRELIHAYGRACALVAVRLGDNAASAEALEQLLRALRKAGLPVDAAAPRDPSGVGGTQ